MGRRTSGGLALLGGLLVAVACGGPGPTTAASTTPSPSRASYSYDCRATAVTDHASAPRAPGVTYATMIVDGKYRDYRMFRPPTPDPTKPVPLVIVLHGTPIDAEGFEAVIHFQSEASAGGFMAVYPDGCDEDWDESGKSYDIDFFNKMLDQLESQFQIDTSRIYVTGASAGGFMTYRVACDMASRIAAVASIAGSMWWSDCAPARPIPILEMHGTADVNVPYDGGRSTYHNGTLLPSVTSVIQRWVGLDGCTGNPVASQSGITQISVWNHCQGDAVVQLDTIVGAHHTWFGSTFDPVPGEPDANKAVWTFLKQFQLPSVAAAQRYVALVRAYWTELQAADVVSGNSNLTAKVCLGVARPNAQTDQQLIDPPVCKQRAQAILAVQQKFLSALGSTIAPTKYSSDDEAFRTQIPKAIADIKALITACGTGSKQAVLDASNTLRRRHGAGGH